MKIASTVRKHLLTTSIVLMSVYAIGLAVATFVEKYEGTEVAKEWIYYSPLFFIVQFLLIACWVGVAVNGDSFRQRKWGMLLTHFAFIVILLGALVSHLFGEEGLLHLREGETTDRIVVRTPDGTINHTLPFKIELKTFTLTRYPGSSSPSAFESQLLLHLSDGSVLPARIYMNNVLDVEGYRFFQASYDRDEEGTVLSVNRDVAGRNITYSGYILLTIGLMLCFVDKRSRFMHLSRQLKSMRAPLCIFLFAGVSSSLLAQTPSSALEAMQKNVVDREHAARFGALPVQSGRGRMLPVNTFSSEVLRKLHKSDTFGSLNSDQFLLGVLTMPEIWMHIPFIAVSNAELIKLYGLPGEQCSYAEMFDANGRYKLQEKLEMAYARRPSEQSRLDKDLIKLDEQINIFYQLLNRRMLNLFPKEDDPQHLWYAPGDDLSAFSGKDSMFVSRILDWYVEEVLTSLQNGDWTKPDKIIDMISTYQQAKNKTLDIRPEKIRAELTYNRLDVFGWCKKGYLILGGSLLILTFLSLFNDRKWMGYTKPMLCGSIIIMFLFHIYGMGMRWYIAGYAPWSNSYETMVYVSWVTVLAGILFVRRSLLTFALATLFGGVILFVSGLSWMDPQINPLVPVLKSPWLMFHVAVIVGAYGFFGISCLIGITNMAVMSVSRKGNREIWFTRIRELSIINEMSLLIGLALMTIGTFLGAVWANESWGRYWGWDPKETWALITMIVYAIVTHLRLIPQGKSLWLFNLSSVAAFYTVLMTFFGVNYFLSGMHSYGQNDNVGGIFIYLGLSLLIIMFLGVASFRKRK